MGESQPHNLRQTTALLARTPAALNALLRSLPDVWTYSNEGGSTWNALEIIGHLIDCERTNWLPRARIILEHGETQPFTPFDRGGHIRETEGRSLDQVLDEFIRLRAENLTQLEALDLQPADLDRRGIHPVFGPITLSELLATWATHDLTHLHQLSRVLAYQYREAVGPWSRYLGVLQCNGHSASA
jgi:DinB superfamily